jgi:iron complex transport system ATP-binding protein
MLPADPVEFRLTGVGKSYDQARVLEDVTVRLSGPCMAAITGPNGAGKSTLLGIMAGLRRDYEGECLLNGVEARRWKPAEFARIVSFVPQSLRLDFPFTAEQVVLMGRTPYAGGLFESPEDWQAVEEAMRLTDTLAFRQRDFRSLSGGERQRVVLASALAQKPRVLLLDEPTTFLDLEHQVAIYRLLRQVSREGVMVVAVTHDLNLAASYSDRILVLRRGALVADAPPCDALTAERIRAVFGVEAEWVERTSGPPFIAYGG